MNRSLSQELSQLVGHTVLLRGWLNNTRSFGKLIFLILRDRKGFAQVVIQNPLEAKKIAHLHPGSILSVSGKVASSKETILGVEIIEPQICVEVPIREAPPVEYYRQELRSDIEHILDHRAISLRHRSMQAVFSIQAALAHAYRLYMCDSVQAVEYFPPNLIGASSEGGAEFFNVDYFGHTATLAQSSQLYKQIMVGVHERVFALTPFFRAEPSHTTRHISEGKQFEFEMGFFEHWHEILEIQEHCLKFMISFIQTYCEKELDGLGNPPMRCPLDTPFPRLTFTEAQELFYARTGKDERQEPDLSPAAERELCSWALETHSTDFLFITDWKTEKRPFYSYPNETDPSLTNTFDLLCSGIEITSGGQRRHTYESMQQGILSKEMDPSHFTDYLMIFKYGMPPHGGFGMGLERLTFALLGLKNIREASLFPSDTKRIAATRIKAKIFFGGENIRNEIIRQLRHHAMEFSHLLHSSASTSQESSAVRNTPLEEGIKALILRGKTTKKNYQFNISSHLKLDMKACGELVKEKCEFEDPETILQRFGVEVGGIPPFGNLLNLETYFDQQIPNSSQVVFNCGLREESISMQTEDLLALVNPTLASFSKK